MIAFLYNKVVERRREKKRKEKKRVSYLKNEISLIGYEKKYNLFTGETNEKKTNNCWDELASVIESDYKFDSIQMFSSEKEMKAYFENNQVKDLRWNPNADWVLYMRKNGIEQVHGYVVYHECNYGNDVTVLDYKKNGMILVGKGDIKRFSIHNIKRQIEFFFHIHGDLIFEEEIKSAAFEKVKSEIETVLEEEKKERDKKGE